MSALVARRSVRGARDMHGVDVDSDHIDILRPLSHRSVSKNHKKSA